MKTIAILSFLCFFFIPSNGQIYGTFRGGWHQAKTKNGSNKIGEPINTFYVGVAVTSNAITKDVLGLYVGINYFKNGWEDGAAFRNYNTLNIEMGPRVNIGPVYLLGGLGANYVLSEKRNLTGVWNVDGKKIDVPVFLGSGLQLGRLNLEYKYHWGLIGPFEFDKQKNRYFQLGLGITIGDFDY